MTEESKNEPSPDEIWYLYLTQGERAMQEKMPRLMRSMTQTTSHVFNLLPSDPRCVWCNAPFQGAGGWLMKAMGRRQSDYNPSICTSCEDFARDHLGGAEVELSMLFADVRGSTTLAEGMSPSEFGELINRFYQSSTEVLVNSKAFIDKLIGDEVAAFYVPGMAGPRHARRAIEAAELLLRQLGHADSDGPWIPVGAGVHTGVAYVGVVGTAGGLTDITVLGDVANTAARLASAAAAGEVLVSEDAWLAADLADDHLEERTLDLKGRSEAVTVKVVRVGAERSKPG